jgi:hypothetical protein
MVPLALFLLVARIFGADDADDTFATNHAAVLAHLLDGGSDFHQFIPVSFVF